MFLPPRVRSTRPTSCHAQRPVLQHPPKKPPRSTTLAAAPAQKAATLNGPRRSTRHALRPPISHPITEKRLTASLSTLSQPQLYALTGILFLEGFLLGACQLLFHRVNAGIDCVLERGRVSLDNVVLARSVELELHILIGWLLKK